MIFRIVNQQRSVNKSKSGLSESSLLASLNESYSTDGKKIPNINLLSLRSDTISTHKYISNKKNILLIYSELTCNICVDSLIENCNILADRYKNIKIWGIASANDLEYLRRYSRINQLKFPLFWDRKEVLISKLKIDMLPAILIIDESGTIINSFFITPQTRDFTPILMRDINKWCSSNKI
jgi:peroxiredoxin